jgi:hypothetical protein
LKSGALYEAKVQRLFPIKRRIFQRKFSSKLRGDRNLNRPIFQISDDTYEKWFFNPTSNYLSQKFLLSTGITRSAELQTVETLQKAVYFDLRSLF